MTRFDGPQSKGGRGHRGRHWAEFGPPMDLRWGGPWGGPGGPGRRMRRGDIKPALLRALLDGPAHGYEIIRRLEERSGGEYRPSAGSVYPTLQMLEEQGLLRCHEDGGKRVYDLTDEGRTEAETGDPGRGFPWEGQEDLSGHRALRTSMGQLVLAFRQVQPAGAPELVERATAVLKEARQKLYQLLAEA